MRNAPNKDLFDFSHLLPEGFPQTPIPVGRSRFFVHMPNLSLEDGLQIAFRRGELRSVAFEEWQPLDSEIAEKRAHLYNETRPVFFVVDEETASERILTRIQRDAQVLYSILTLFGMRADPPGTSTDYVSCGKAVVRSIGVHDRRAILNGPVRFRIKAIGETFLDALPSFDRHAAAFDLPEVARAIKACNFDLKDVHRIDAIMHLTIALEALLLEDVTTGITTAFAKRVGQFILEAGESISELERDLKVLYAIRSDALHGRDWANSITGTSRDESSWASWAHEILLRALNRVVNKVGCAADSRNALTQLRLSLIS